MAGPNKVRAVEEIIESQLQRQFFILINSQNMFTRPNRSFAVRSENKWRNDGLLHTCGRCPLRFITMSRGKCIITGGATRNTLDWLIEMAPHPLVRAQRKRDRTRH